MALSISISSAADLRAIERARRSLDQFADNADTNANRLRNFGSGLQNVGKRLTMFSAAAAAGLGVFAKGAIDAAQEAEVASNRLDAIAKSMGFLGPVLGGTTNRLQDFASSLQSTIAVEDETIMATQSLLLTFSEVGKTAGEAGGAFDRATKAAFDLSAAGFGSADSAAKMLGKALQDPIKGITALSRAGVTFTAAQKEQIQGFIDSGQAAKAQEMILREVERQVSGTAAATATGGAKMKIAFGEVQEQLGTALLPVFQQFTQFMLDRGIPAIQGLVDKFLALSPQMKGVIAAAGGLLLALGPLLMVAGTLVKALAGLGPALAAVKAGLLGVGPLMAALGAAAGPVLLVVGAVVALGAGFVALYRYSEPVQKAVSYLVKQFELMAQTVGVALVDAFRSILGGGDGLRSFGDVMRNLGDRVAPVVTKAIQFVASGMDDLGVVIRFQIKVFETLVKVFTMVSEIVRVTLFNAFELLVDTFNNTIKNVDLLLKKMGPFGEFLRTFAINMINAFQNAGNAIVTSFRNIGSNLERIINIAIGGLNLLIEGYNQIPGVTPVAPIKEFSFAMSAAATATQNAANATAQFSGNIKNFYAGGGIPRVTEDMITATTAANGLAGTATGGGLTGAGNAAKTAADKFNLALAPAVERFVNAMKTLTDLRTSVTEFFASLLPPVDPSVVFANASAALQDFMTRVDGLKKVGPGAADAFKGLVDATTSAARSALDALMAKLGEAEREMDDYRRRVTDALIGAFSFADAITAAEKAGENILTAIQTGLQKQLDFIALIEQVRTQLGPNSALFMQLVQLGPVQGAAFAKALLEGGVGEMQKIEGLMAAVKNAATNVGIGSATSYFGAGVKLAQDQVTGMMTQLETMAPQILGFMDRLAEKMKRTVIIQVKVSQDQFNVDVHVTKHIREVVSRTVEEFVSRVEGRAGGGPVRGGMPYVVGERGPELFVPGVSGTIIPNDVGVGTPTGATGGPIFHIKVNAGMGTDGASVGRQIVDAIRKFERFNGPVFQAA